MLCRNIKSCYLRRSALLPAGSVSIWLTLCSKTAGMAAFCTVLSAQPVCLMQPSRRSSNAPVWMLRILCRQSGLPSRKEKTSCENSVGPISCAERTCAEPGARQSFDHGRCGFVNQQKVDKAGEMIKEDAVVEVRGHDIGYVSRGGLKLERL